MAPEAFDRLTVYAVKFHQTGGSVSSNGSISINYIWGFLVFGSFSGVQRSYVVGSVLGLRTQLKEYI